MTMKTKIISNRCENSAVVAVVVVSRIAHAAEMLTRPYSQNVLDVVIKSKINYLMAVTLIHLCIKPFRLYKVSQHKSRVIRISMLQHSLQVHAPHSRTSQPKASATLTTNCQSCSNVSKSLNSITSSVSNSYNNNRYCKNSSMHNDYRHHDSSTSSDTVNKSNVQVNTVY